MSMRITIIEGPGNVMVMRSVIAGEWKTTTTFHLPDNQDCWEVKTEGSGYCYIHRPHGADNPSASWVFVPEGGDWRREYASLKELAESEGGDWYKVD